MHVTTHSVATLMKTIPCRWKTLVRHSEYDHYQLCAVSIQNVDDYGSLQLPFPYSSKKRLPLSHTLLSLLCHQLTKSGNFFQFPSTRPSFITSFEYHHIPRHFKMSSDFNYECIFSSLFRTSPLLTCTVHGILSICL